MGLLTIVGVGVRAEIIPATVVGLGVRVGVSVVLDIIPLKLLPGLNLPVITAKNTITTTNPRTKEIILLKLSIRIVL